MKRQITGFIAFWLLLASAASAQVLPPLTNCDPAKPGVYTTACQGETVCFNATGTSGIAIPINTGRKYILIQTQSTIYPLYLAIGGTTGNPLVAVIGQNTIQLGPQAPIPSNYELNAIANGGNAGVPRGAIALITGGTTIAVCILEHNG